MSQLEVITSDEVQAGQALRRPRAPEGQGLPKLDDTTVVVRTTRQASRSPSGGCRNKVGRIGGG